MKKSKILVTGGAGFIGSALIREFLKQEYIEILNIDKLTYASNTNSLKEFEQKSNYSFSRTDLAIRDDIHQLFFSFKPNAVIHLAAESHVDNSIKSPSEFIYSNIIGTYNLLDVSLNYFKSIDKLKKKDFRFVHISTDEVFGSLGRDGFFKEDSRYKPNSPYSASKASSDHLVRAWNKTYNFPAIITNCSNNFGPFQNIEKLIPKCISNALNHMKIPIYGNGMQVRDWLYVKDHVKAIDLVLNKGKIGETYNIGASNDITNISLIKKICEILDELKPIENKLISKYSDLIDFVDDRPGHDQRYAIDASKIINELEWKPKNSFDNDLRETVSWYLNNL